MKAAHEACKYTEKHGYTLITPNGEKLFFLVPSKTFLKGE